jgi:hypothetical protein
LLGIYLFQPHLLRVILPSKQFHNSSEKERSLIPAFANSHQEPYDTHLAPKGVTSQMFPCVSSCNSLPLAKRPPTLSSSPPKKEHSLLLLQGGHPSSYPALTKTNHHADPSHHIYTHNSREPDYMSFWPVVGSQQPINHKCRDRQTDTSSILQHSDREKKRKENILPLMRT